MPRGAPTIRRDPWTAEDVGSLRAAYLDAGKGPMDLNALALKLGRSHAAVAIKASRLGLGDYGRRRVEERKRKNKYVTVAEARAAISASARKRIADKGHPRGALGMKHTPQAKIKMAAAAARFNASVTPEMRELMTMKANAAKIAKYGTAGPSARFAERPFSRCKGGKRHDLGDFYFRSSWEANYARYLNWLVAHKQINRWSYEKRTFRFDGITRGCSTYTPDFEVVNLDGSYEYHEIKGWMDQPSRTRLDRMGRYHPSVKLVLVDAPQYRAIEKSIAASLPWWEGRVTKKWARLFS